ncbi:uncharacterized protein MELLADRAFT_52030 [Melampsora larici-populina 98AG31]|uniref:Uncharacterized protein n=1 Tax=Melampsora larici-populina (strain 98AG31 / pathotype 3-4-7) TaxID=747676 RepID=F4RE40_MELLP|nr:uncharacterized protein MELLADRAFT_52030 [Melampsora larici-populina 98AG31]EGG09028.1 hypothetical protein MELLADRAFT_52030 [Melampsora larici-populina 98AG31]
MENYIRFTNVQRVKHTNVKKSEEEQAVVHVCVIAKPCMHYKKQLEISACNCLTFWSRWDSSLSIVMMTNVCKMCAIRC